MLSTGAAVSASINSFSVPGRYVFGFDSLETLAEDCRGRVLLVTDRPVMEKAGHLAKTVSAVQRDGGSVAEIVSVEAEPPMDQVLTAACVARKLKPDAIVALGGGAVIDAAKGIRYLAALPENAAARFFSEGPLDSELPADLSVRCRLVAVPTTSGTGSEGTRAAVFSDPQTGHKRLFLSPFLLPDTAILDPGLTMTLPRSVTAQSGFDAFAHGVESFICTVSTPYSRGLAAEAVRLILRRLPAALENGSDRLMREDLLLASGMAGIAINNSCTGLSHSLDQIGAVFGLAHGVALAPLFVPVLRTCAQASPGTLGRLFRCADDSVDTGGDGGGADKRNADGNPRRDAPRERAKVGPDSDDDAFIATAARLIRLCGLPRSFAELGIGREEYDRVADSILPCALNAFATAVAPGETGRERLVRIIDEAYHGA